MSSWTSSRTLTSLLDIAWKQHIRQNSTANFMFTIGTSDSVLLLFSMFIISLKYVYMYQRYMFTSYVFTTIKLIISLRVVAKVMTFLVALSEAHMVSVFCILFVFWHMWQPILNKEASSKHVVYLIILKESSL